MNTTIFFFGALTDRFGRERQLELPPDGLSIAALRRMLAPEGVELGAGTRAAIDQQLAREDDVARPGQEIAFFSPVSGG